MDRMRIAISLSVKHWEENRRLAESGRLDRHNITSHGCALCKWVDEIDADCNICPLTLVTGLSCNELESPWMTVNDGMGENDDTLLSAVNDVLIALRVAESLTLEEIFACRVRRAIGWITRSPSDHIARWPDGTVDGVMLQLKRDADEPYWYCPELHGDELGELLQGARDKGARI